MAEWVELECPECHRLLFFTDDTDIVLCGYGCWETHPVLWEDPNDEDEYDSPTQDDDE